MQRRDWALYGALALARVVVAFTSQSIIHPDEHFQNAEISASLFFDYSPDGDGPHRTWEWLGDSPGRCIAPVLGTTGRAFQLLRWLGISSPDATTLFASERAVMLLLSFSLDLVVARLSRQPRLPLLLLASSPVAFSFLLRTFSNPLETLFLAALYLEYADLKSSRLAIQLGALGAVLAAGIFTRSTFAAFVLPVLLFLAWRVGRHKSDGSATSFSLARLILRGLPLPIGFLITSVLLAAFDTAFFRLGSTSVRDALAMLADPHSLIWTPINLLRYNASTDNLAQHGLHPLWLHAVVNMPMLHGAGLAIVASAAWAVLRRGAPKEKDETERQRPLIYLATVLVSLPLVSLLPHQEPRYILPFIVPIVLLAPYAPMFQSGTRRAARSRKVFWALWLTHTAVLTVVFGYLHQGGVLPAIFALNRELRDPATRLGGASDVDVVFWRTFMPPRHLLLPIPQANQSVPAVRVTDLAGAPPSTLLDTLATTAALSSDRDGRRIAVLAAPAYAIDALGLTCLPAGGATPKCLELLDPERRSYGVQVDMDRLGDLRSASWATAGVGVWVLE
ncbi:glycosylphosphatidylinositol-alpha 1,2 mannosyltransferase [Rhodotorula paludigena]|uniref:glycosylphosphatidylinositol-alpha 1,2 mannosyltransferase n=1 Tax=Rhodotorula paludigena TaxID=86838 RepID=UPI00317C1101